MFGKLKDCFGNFFSRISKEDISRIEMERLEMMQHEHAMRDVKELHAAEERDVFIELLMKKLREKRKTKEKE